MPATCEPIVKERVSATDFRDRLSENLKAAKGAVVVLIETRGQESRYVVDKQWLDDLMRERQSILATLEVLVDRELTERLLKTAQTIDADIQAGRLKTIAEVFGE